MKIPVPPPASLSELKGHILKDGASSQRMLALLTHPICRTSNLAAIF